MITILNNNVLRDIPTKEKIIFLKLKRFFLFDNLKNTERFFNLSLYLGELEGGLKK